jgi:hypothetical protein
MKSPLIEMLQTKFPADPNSRSSSRDRGDSTDSKTVIRAEDLDAVPGKHSYLVSRAAEPDATEIIRKLTNHN